MLTGSITGDIKYQFRYGNMVVKLIFVNIAVFIVVGLSYLVYFLFQPNPGFAKQSFDLLLTTFEAPASLPHLLHQPWSPVTYMFLHQNFLHILFNMLWLYWFGEIFVLYLGEKKVLPLYLLGGIAGAVIYMLVYNFIPAFKSSLALSYMLGASASIYAIVFAATAINPEHEIGLMFIGAVRIKYIALVALLLDIINIPYGNAGGYIAHVGGALSGFLYIKALQSGFDLFSPFNNFTGFVAGLFKRRPNVKVSHRSEEQKPANTAKRSKSDQEKVDEILDKIARSGYDSLTKEEKDFLFNYSKK